MERSERADIRVTTTADDLKPLALTLSPESGSAARTAGSTGRIGFYPLSLRQSLRNGFNRERMQPGHQNWFLDPDAGRTAAAIGLPLDPVMMRWHYGRLRLRSASRCSSGCARSGRRSCSPTSRCTPSFRSSSADGATALPLVGHVASWDHTVGKGIVSPHLRRYIVQNDVMRDDLVRYHGIEARADRRHGLAADRRVPPAATARGIRIASFARLGLDPTRPVVLVMGNTPTNAPFEQRSSSGSSTGGRRAARHRAFRCCSGRIRVTGSGASASRLRCSGTVWPSRSRASRISRRSPFSSSTATSWSRMPGRSCSTHWSTTGRRSAFSTTKARPPARAGRSRTSAASTTVS